MHAVLALDISGLLTEKDLHEYLAKKLNFPGYYGHNFDAFWDCITDDEQSSMPEHLIVEGLAEFRRLLPRQHSLFISCLKDYELEFPNRKITYREGCSSEAD